MKAPTKAELREQLEEALLQNEVLVAKNKVLRKELKELRIASRRNNRKD